MKLKKIKKLLANKNWVENKLNYYINKSTDWHKFEMFKCNDFFVGHYAAERNKKIYKRVINKLNRRIEFLQNVQGNLSKRRTTTIE